MHYKGYIIDLDGTTYRGNEIIHGAKQFHAFLQEKTIPYIYLTNNSTYTKEALIDKLTNLGIIVTDEQVMTSSMATANYLQRIRNNARCFVIGEEGLLKALVDKGFTITDQAVDFVIIGLDRHVTYEKLATATKLIREGATFVATNSDAAIPTETGLKPGNGAVVAALTVSSGKQPIVIGKPEKVIMEETIRQMGVEKEDVLMIGDNYDTDIKAGINSNIDTLLVLTGYSSKKDIEHVSAKPTYITENLQAWLQKLT